MSVEMECHCRWCRANEALTEKVTRPILRAPLVLTVSAIGAFMITATFLIAYLMP